MLLGNHIYLFLSISSLFFGPVDSVVDQLHEYMLLNSKESSFANKDEWQAKMAEVKWKHR